MASIAADPTAFYAAVAALGFRPSYTDPHVGYTLLDNDEAGLRVIRYDDDAERMVFVGWVKGNRTRLLAWEVAFNGTTPAAVAMAAITAALAA